MSLKLSWKTLGELNRGVVGDVIDQAIRDAIHDVDQRGTDWKPRHVDIRMTIERRKDDDYEVTVNVDVKKPKYKTPSHVCEMRDTGGEFSLTFTGIVPERADQPALFEAPKEQKAAGQTA